MAPLSRLTAEQRAEIDHLQDQKGWGRRKIARSLGIGEKAVRYYCERRDADSYPDPVPLRSVVWDLETTNLKADIGTLMVAGFLDLITGEVTVRTIMDFEGTTIEEREGLLACWASSQFCLADILIGHNSLGFDRNFLNGVCGRHGLEPLPKRLHIDTLQVARHGFKGLMQSNSLENLGDFFKVGVKNKPSKHDWRLANLTDPDAISRITERNVSDLFLTAAVWSKLLPHWQRWRGQ